MNIKDKIKKICTYHTKGETSGYLLDEDRFAKIFALLDEQKNKFKKIIEPTDEFEESYCKENEHLLQSIKKKS